MGDLRGVFLLGILTPGESMARLLQLAFWGVPWCNGGYQKGINPWFLTFTRVGSCVVIGLIAGIFLPGVRKELNGLTVYTLPKA